MRRELVRGARPGPEPRDADLISSLDCRHADSGRTTTLGLGAFASLALLVVSLQWDPMLDRRIYHWLHPVQGPVTPPLISQYAADPPAGTELPLTPSGRAIRAAVASSPRGYMLVYLGACSSCLKADLGVWRAQAAQAGLRTVFLTTANDRVAEEFRKTQDLGEVPLIANADQGLVRRLNAFLAPRGYLFTSDWRLRVPRASGARGAPIQ